MATVIIDLTSAETIDESLARLDPRSRDSIMSAARRRLSAENDAAILAIIRATLATRYTDPGEPAPVGVVFPTGEWDEGFFLTEEGFVLLTDGTIDEVHFDGLDPLFGREFGIRGRHYTLAVDLRTGELDGNDDNDCTDDSIRARFHDLSAPTTPTTNDTESESTR